MSRLDSIRVALTQYDLSIGSYAEGMRLVEEGTIAPGNLASIDEDRADAALDFVDEAADFIREILPHLDALRAATSGLREPGPSFAGTATLAAATALVSEVTASHRGTPTTEGTNHE